MSYQRPFLISLKRSSSFQPWGFTLTGGRNGPVTIREVTPNSLADRSGLKSADHVIQVGPVNVEDLAPEEVIDVISRCRNPLEMYIVREPQPHHGGRIKTEVGTATTGDYSSHETRFDHRSPRYTAGRHSQTPQPSSPGVYGTEAPVLKRSAVYQVLKEEEARGYHNAPTYDRFRTQRNQQPLSPTRAPTAQPQFSTVSSPTVHYPKGSAVYHVAPVRAAPVSPSPHSPVSPSSAARQRSFPATPTGGSAPPPTQSHATHHAPVTSTTKGFQQQKVFPAQYSRPKTYYSTVKMAPSPTGSPSTVRKGRSEVWPPKTSSVRMLPKTGFSPTVMREHGYQGKRFVWPPPKDGNTPERGEPGEVPHANYIKWNPSNQSPTARGPVFAPNDSPTRRCTDHIWPPPESGREFVTKPMPRPVRRVGKFEDFVKYRSSIGVPPTYRPPPGTQHSQVNGQATEEVEEEEEVEYEEVEESE